MRILSAVLSFALMAFAAAAVDEAPEIAWGKGSDLSGIWRIATPAGGKITVGFGSDVQFEAMEEEFCRIGQKGDDLWVRCLGPHHYSQVGEGEIDGGKLHLAWGSMALRFVIDAPLVSAVHFDGRFAVKVVGSRHEAPEAATGTKLALALDAPDPEGLKPVLLQAIDEYMNGGLKLPHDQKAINRNIDGREPTPAKKLRDFGKVVGAIYLGKVETKDEAGKRRPFFSVYDVEFENGERLCGLHRRNDGVIDGFLCV